MTVLWPFRWAQWVAGLDLLPALPAGLLVQGSISPEALQAALHSYIRDKRSIRILTTLVERAEDASELRYCRQCLYVVLLSFD